MNSQRYPATLKALIDSSGAVWHAKPVAFASYGGVSGGLRAVEQLRLGALDRTRTPKRLDLGKRPCGREEFWLRANALTERSGLGRFG